MIVGPVVPTTGPLRPLGLESVTITGGFWARWQQVNAAGIIPHANAWEERAGWIDNFRLAASGSLQGRRRGREFSDSDVYKLLEAMAWEHARTGEAWLDQRVRDVAELVAAVQEPDGYLNTMFGRPGQELRYTDFAWGHELYCYGHLIQAAVARIRSGVRDLLVEVAVRAADHVCEQFGPGGRAVVGGHPEIEPALVELYRATGERRYLETARELVNRRGSGTLPDIEFGRAYYQDDVPVRSAGTLRGHAVRALYLAAGALDVAVEDDDGELLSAVADQYRNGLARRTYLTGGMGSHHQDEAFGEDYELPPDRAYSETCAGVGSVMVAWRLALATGDLAWSDVIERTLYNVIATSPSASGDAFFYANPLQVRRPGEVSDPNEQSPRAGSQLRAPWFDVSCCPTNVSRTLAQLATYVATISQEGLAIHQFMPCRIESEVGAAGRVVVEIETGYPYDGDVVVRVVEAGGGEWELALRVPAWAGGSALLDGQPVAGQVARLKRRFSAGDMVRLTLPMAARVVRARSEVDAVRGCIAVERGPFVLAAESVDAGWDVTHLSVEAASVRDGEEPGTALVDAHRCLAPATAWPYGGDGASSGAAGDLAGVAADTAGAADISRDAGSPDAPVNLAGAASIPRDAARSGPDGTAGNASQPAEPSELVLHPYFGWGERGPSTMRVWLPEQ